MLRSNFIRIQIFLFKFYGIRLLQIFQIFSISNEKPSISIEILGISNQKF